MFKEPGSPFERQVPLYASRWGVGNRKYSAFSQCLTANWTSSAHSKKDCAATGPEADTANFLREFIQLRCGTAAYGVLGKAHSQVRVSDQKICLKESRRKLLYFMWDRRRRATTERQVPSRMLALSRLQTSLNVPEWRPNSQHQSWSRRRRISAPKHFAS